MDGWLNPSLPCRHHPLNRVISQASALNLTSATNVFAVRRPALQELYGRGLLRAMEADGMQMGGSRNYGPFLGPYYNTAPII